MKNTFAKYIREKRLEAGLSQAQAAKKLGMHSQLISNWERGRCFVPLKRMKAVAKIYGVELQSVFANYCVEILNRELKTVMRGK